MITIEISGVPIDRVKGSARIRKAIEERSTASFQVYDEAGTELYQKGQPVEILSGVDTLFAGFITDADRTRLQGSASLIHDITCVGNVYLADKRLAGQSYESKTAGFIVQDLVTKYLAAEGVTVLDIQTGPTIAEMVINYAPVSEAIAKLAEYSGFIWFINDDKELFFGLRESIAAPFAIDSGDIRRFSPRMKQSAYQYRNRQYLRAGRDITVLQTETYNVTDGDQLAFALGFPLAKEPVSIEVDGTPQTMGIKGIDSAKDVYWSSGDPILVFDTAPAIGGPVTLVVEYYGEYDVLVQVDNVAGVAARQAIEGGSGYVEAIDDEPWISSSATAFDVALAKLEKYGVIGEVFSFEIFDGGLEPGELLTVTYAEYGLSATEMLIESIEIYELGPGQPIYAIKAITGPPQGDWSKLFLRLARAKDDVLDRLNIGKDTILIILAQTDETVEVSETIVEDVYTCTFCDGVACGVGVLVC